MEELKGEKRKVNINTLEKSNELRWWRECLLELCENVNEQWTTAENALFDFFQLFMADIPELWKLTALEN